MTPAAGISGPVMAAVPCAALMHAGWNALVKAKGDAFLSTVLVTASAGLLCLLALPFLAQPAPASWPFIAASSITQVLYYALLMETYREGDISHAYPLMRGCAPLIVAVLGLPFTGERLAALQWLAIGLICGGVLTMVAAVRGTALSARRTTLLALTTACVIAAYTLVDGIGVRRSGAPAAWRIAAVRAPPSRAAGRRRDDRRVVWRGLMGDDPGAGGHGRRAARDLDPVHHCHRAAGSARTGRAATSAWCGPDCLRRGVDAASLELRLHRRPQRHPHRIRPAAQHQPTPLFQITAARAEVLVQQVLARHA